MGTVAPPAGARHHVGLSTVPVNGVRRGPRFPPFIGRSCARQGCLLLGVVATRVAGAGPGCGWPKDPAPMFGLLFASRA